MHKSSTDLPMFLQYENLEANEYEDYEWKQFGHDQNTYSDYSQRPSTNKNKYVTPNFGEENLNDYEYEYVTNIASLL